MAAGDSGKLSPNMRPLALSLTLAGLMATLMTAQSGAPPARPQGPCDIYAADAAPCVAAHSTTRALYAPYNGPLYQVLRQSDGKTLDIGVVSQHVTGARSRRLRRRGRAGRVLRQHLLLDHDALRPVPQAQRPHPGAARRLQRPGHGRLQQPADRRHGADHDHRPQGLRRVHRAGHGPAQNDAKGTAVDDQAEGQYWVINGRHYNSGCCFDYGNAEIDSRDDGNGTMETTYYGNATGWYHGHRPARGS